MYDFLIVQRQRPRCLTRPFWCVCYHYLAPSYTYDIRNKEGEHRRDIISLLVLKSQSRSSKSVLVD